jgi:hypothetical protein
LLRVVVCDKAAKLRPMTTPTSTHAFTPIPASSGTVHLSVEAIVHDPVFFQDLLSTPTDAKAGTTASCGDVGADVEQRRTDSPLKATPKRSLFTPEALRLSSKQAAVDAVEGVSASVAASWGVHVGEPATSPCDLAVGQTCRKGPDVRATVRY